MFRWRLKLAWRGERYIGWQHQPNGTSIQSVVEDALGQALGLKDAQGATAGEPLPRVTAAGRTDSGVHARMQYAAFRTSVERSPSALRNGLNFHLPDDVVCLEAVQVALDFDPIRAAQRKMYRYRILNRAIRCPLRSGVVWRVRAGLDVPSMSAAAGHLVGSHDFTSFRARGCAAVDPVRHIESVEVRTADDDEIHIDFVGKGFLRHQVRIMVGTLVDVGLRRTEPEGVVEIIEARDRNRAGRTMPACGLWLMWVELEASTEVNDS